MLEVPDATLDALEGVEALLRSHLSDGTDTGRTALRTIDAGGKRLRPLLVLLSCQSAGGRIDDRAVRVAAGAELIHTASLVHDDVMDDASLRRGEPTIYAAQGAARAITVGDYLFVKGYELAALDLDPEIIRVVARACAGLAEGQYKEEDLKADPTNSELYLYVVENKTAGFIAACAELGAHVAGARGPLRAAYRDFGYNLGVAFQLIDDVLDATGSVEATGKDVKNDVRNGGKGGPVVFGLQTDHTKLGRLVMDFYQQNGVARTRELAQEFARRADRAASGFPPNDFSKALRDVARVLLERDR